MKNKEKLALIVFLLGIFIGAMDTGIVSPVRTVIGDAFKISPNLSIWMITIYTLAYAVAMPISGKLSDKYGKRRIYTLSIIIFGVGSVLCGVSNYFDSFYFLLFARVVQAIGGGGIMPIATAYIGESFPQEKRGSALGLVGAVYGIATTLGPTIGSALINLVGASNWGVVFFINVPICIVVIILANGLKEDTVKEKLDKAMDVKGSVILSIMILSLMYGLTNLKFYDFKATITNLDVYPFLIIFVLLIPVFIFIENKAEDPVLNLKYFKDRDIVITLIISFIVGCGLMGIVFVPQFGENVLKIKTGSGGYLVTLMAIFSGIAAPFGGKLVDKYSAKLILIMGFLSTIIGTITLALFAAKTSSSVALFIGLAFMGLGMGFTMGTPLNYLMQSYVDKNETATAQSTLSLIRSIGVAISPNLLVGFIAEAGKNMQPKLMEVVPKITMPNIPGIPQNVPGMGSSMSSQSGVDKLINADITTIFASLREFMINILDGISKGIGAKLPPNMNGEKLLEGWKQGYLQNFDSSRATIENTFQNVLNSGFSKLFIGSCIIAVIGLIFTLMIRNNKNSKVI